MHNLQVRIFLLYLYVQKIVMDKKLTLKLDELVIEKAKVYASNHKKSLSRMIESYLRALVDKEPDLPQSEIEISPFIKSMQTGVHVPDSFNYKEEYGKYLAEKYK